MQVTWQDSTYLAQIIKCSLLTLKWNLIYWNYLYLQPSYYQIRLKSIPIIQIWSQALCPWRIEFKDTAKLIFCAALRWESDSKWLATGDWTWRATDGRIHSKWKFNLCEILQHLTEMKCIKMETRNVFGSSSWISCLKFLKLSFLIFNVSKKQRTYSEFLMHLQFRIQYLWDIQRMKNLCLWDANFYPK